MVKQSADAVGDTGRTELSQRDLSGFALAKPDVQTVAVSANTPVGAAAALDAGVREALAENRFGAARTLVAAAEAVLAAHEQSASRTQSEEISRIDMAAAKARIAVASGDNHAAHAILVQAIEAHADAPALRLLMTEIMFATGRATDIRPVLHHLGRPPVNGFDPLQEATGKVDKKG